MLCLKSVQVLRLKESQCFMLQVPLEDWTTGLLPEDTSAQIQVLNLAAQDLAVTVPGWPALQHVRLESHSNQTLNFEDAAVSAVTLESFELIGNGHFHIGGPGAHALPNGADCSGEFFPKPGSLFTAVCRMRLDFSLPRMALCAQQNHL